MSHLSHSHFSIRITLIATYLFVTTLIATYIRTTQTLERNPNPNSIGVSIRLQDARMLAAQGIQRCPDIHRCFAMAPWKAIYSLGNV